ncbi:RNA-binding domain-containing protein [Candidatus Poriferisodalis sp.]|uniref:RNA-binding domain-containing protein n=1 Tax=Candidatus Poriferisodalis sp. TaxID=3101277 RepID=UPI003B0296FF
MSFHLPHEDSLDQMVATALEQLSAGALPPQIESTHIDFKEEPDRRASDGSILDGAQRSEAAASYLAGEMACMANTPGGGAVIVGVADDGTLIGTALDAEWLRNRIWQLTHQQVTVAAREVDAPECRLLVLSTPGALAPVSYRGRLKWRVGADCVDVDPVAWQAHALQRLGYDWSAEASSHTLGDVSPLAAEAARTYLREADTAAGRQLADATDREMLTRLGVADADGRLTQAGSLLFVATPCDGIDFIRRSSAGGDSTERIRTSKPLLVQLREVEQAGRLANPVSHVALGFAHRQVRSIPERAFREAIVNGVTHRDWMMPLPTVVEHVGTALTVTSPGGLIGGVTPANAMTHPAVPRYRSLAHALALLHVAEQQGIGIDRMVLDLLTIGRPAPVIEEIDGPYVRVTLLGGEPDSELVRWVAAVEPPYATDAYGLLVIEHLCRRGWIDARDASGLLQSSEATAADVLARLSEASSEAQSVIVEVVGADGEAGRGTAYRLGDVARDRLAHRCLTRRSRETAEAMFVGWAQARGRISSTSAADLAGTSTRMASERLRLLADRGKLMPGRANGTGRGYHYVPAAGH